MSQIVTVSDENGNKYNGIPCKPGQLPEAGSDEKTKVFVLFDGSDNGFGATSPDVKNLKHLPSGDFGA